MKLIVGILLLIMTGVFAEEVDTFGIQQFYPAKAGTVQWNSTHWNNGIERTVHYSDDEFDPTNWTEDHSGGTDGFFIDGNGIMRMSGSGPRFHINSLDDAKGVTQFFRDIEFTAYYKRRGVAGKNWGGMVVGMRSGPLGHASSGGDNCDATTYYARFRNDGKWDFEKELKHPGSDYWSGSGFQKQDPLWGGTPLPLDRWIGMKYLAYNVNDGEHVRLEVYIDSTTNGEPVGGGNWELVGTVTDSGNWPSGEVSGCDFEQDAIILEGNGTVLMRTDGDTAYYKWVTVREIDPNGATGTEIKGGGSSYALYLQDRSIQRIFCRNGMFQGNGVPPGCCYRVFSVQGKLMKRSVVAGGNGVVVSGVCQGVYLVEWERK